jgi:hypothetical protein
MEISSAQSLSSGDRLYSDPELRILHDAALIKRGARISERGILHLTDVQLEVVALHGDPLYEINNTSDINLLREVSRTEQEKWLNTNIAWLNFGDSTAASRLQNAFERSGIETIRDVLVLGRYRIKKMQNIGAVSISKIEDVLNVGEQKDCEWKNKPTPADIAEFCDNLSQVAAAVLERYPPHYYMVAGLSVQDLLTGNYEEIISKNPRFCSENFVNYKSEAISFAQAFYDAKTASSNSQS